MNKLIRKIILAATGCVTMFSLTAVSAEANDPAAPSTIETTYPVSNPFNPLSEAGVIINDHYVYCIDPKGHSWPSTDGLLYHQISNTDLTNEQQEELKRTLNAGYPIDAYGLSKLTNESNQYRGTYTQYVVWAILGDGSYKSFVETTTNAYLKALYEYALSGKINGSIPTSLNNEMTVSESILSANVNGTFSGELYFTSNKNFSVTITSIPEGISLSIGEKKLALGDVVETSDVLTVNAVSAFSSGNIDFKYVSNIRASEELTVFKTDQINGTGDSALPYQRMIGYGYTQATASISAEVKIKADTPTTEDTPDDTPTTPETTDKVPTVDTPTTTDTPSSPVTTVDTPATVDTPVSTETVRPTTPATNEKTETISVTETDSSRNERPSTPNTGDQSNVALAAGVLGIAVIVIGITVFFRKRFSE